MIDWWGARPICPCARSSISRCRRGLWSFVPVGQIGCDGETRTVALFSRVPLEEIEEIACDVESHTSVALVQVLLAERTGRRPAVTPFPGPSAETPESVLLIGDKVARLAPPASTHPHRVDLGLAWKELTGLPFVFAAWFRLAEVEEMRESGPSVSLRWSTTRDVVTGP